MSAPYASTTAPAVPATKEFTVAWIAYLLYLSSAILLWPAVIGLIISYSKRGSTATGFIDSHHRWMLRSFWYSQLWFTLFFIVLMIGVWPLVSSIITQAIAAAEAGRDPTFDFELEPIFEKVGAATLGGIGIGATWLWFIYRMLRGMITLNDARTMP